MKKRFLICLLLSLTIWLSACSWKTSTPNVDNGPSGMGTVFDDREQLSTEEFTATPSESLPPQGHGNAAEEAEGMAQPILPGQKENKLEKDVQELELVLSVNETPLDVRWEDNRTVAELIAYARNEAIVVNTTRYGGFEQVGSLPQGFSTNDVQITTEPGDIVLYSGNQLVVFFGSNSWSYTMLGHIEGLSTDELSELLGGSSADIEIKISETCS